MPDITLLSPTSYARGSRKYKIVAGVLDSIVTGQLVLSTDLGSPYALAFTTSGTGQPVVGTDHILGLSTSDSTDTVAAAGYVEVMPITSDMVFLINPGTAATWDTQAEYDALVGDRVLLSISSAGVQTILAADGSTYGLIIEPLDVAKHPGKVAFKVRTACLYSV